jgi:pyridoxamine 5'-phosphate oxidase
MEQNIDEKPASAPPLTEPDEPLQLFREWFEQAKLTEPNDPNAMSLATVDENAMPNVRMVLLKDFDARGFVFYTNCESQKGVEILRNPQAALSFHWKSLRRQVRLRGAVEKVDAAEADAYFATRPRESRIGAWASAQSRPLESRFALEKSVAKFAARYAIGEIPRPPYWCGLRLVPVTIEFWQDRPFRLHDRLVFTRPRPGAPWSTARLYP